jgi:hypothetical protein
MPKPAYVLFDSDTPASKIAEALMEHYTKGALDGSITKREDVNPKEGKKKYGNVPFADMRNHKYPLDEKHVAAAASYFGKPENRAKYSKEEQKIIDGRIRAAKKKFHIGEFAKGK